MTQKELYVFNTLLKWYKMEWRPDDLNHFNEIFNMARSLVEKEAAEKQRPILTEVLNSIPAIGPEEIKCMVNQENGNADTSLLVGLLLLFTFNFGVFSRRASHQTLNRLKDCAEKMDKLIFLITHEGFEEMMEPK